MMDYYVLGHILAILFMENAKQADIPKQTALASVMINYWSLLLDCKLACQRQIAMHY